MTMMGMLHPFTIVPHCLPTSIKCVTVCVVCVDFLKVANKSQPWPSILHRFVPYLMCTLCSTRRGMHFSVRSCDALINRLIHSICSDSDGRSLLLGSAFFFSSTSTPLRLANSHVDDDFFRFEPWMRAVLG